MVYVPEAEAEAEPPSSEPEASRSESESTMLIGADFDIASHLCKVQKLNFTKCL